MNSDWPIVSISALAAPFPGSLAVGPFGSRMKADLYVPTGVRVIRGNNLSGSRELEGTFVCVPEETADSLASCCLKPGDLVFPHRGNIGEVGITPDDGHRYMLSTSLMKLSPNHAKVNSLFLMYFFKSAVGRAALLMNSSQVGTPGIATPLKSLRSIELRLPPLSVQHEIAGMLSKLDDRITVLRETNGTLEAIAQTLYKSWFVDFDPVHAKTEGRTPEGMDEATAALFPDGLEESELGPVPRGWRIVKLQAATSSVFSGGTPDTRKPEFWGGDIPWFSSGETRNSVITDTEKRITQAGVDESSTRPVRLGDILIASAGQGHTRGQTSYCGIDCYINQSVVAVRAGELSKASWLFCNLKRRYQEMRNLSDSHSSRGSLTTKLLNQMPLVLPPLDIIDAFDDVATPLLNSIICNEKQAQSLSALRDALLPRLMSGQLRLPDLNNEIKAIAA